MGIAKHTHPDKIRQQFPAVFVHIKSKIVHAKTSDLGVGYIDIILIIDISLLCSWKKVALVHVHTFREKVSYKPYRRQSKLFFQSLSTYLKQRFSAEIDHSLKNEFTSNKISVSEAPFVIEKASIDEAYVEIRRAKEVPHEEAYKLQQYLQKSTGVIYLFNIEYLYDRWFYLHSGLQCSIGVSHNNLIAKLASSKAKPFGIHHIKRMDVTSILQQTPCSRLPGCGSRAAHLLQTEYDCKVKINDFRVIGFNCHCHVHSVSGRWSPICNNWVGNNLAHFLELIWSNSKRMEERNWK